MARSLSNEAYRLFIAGLVDARKAAGVTQVELADRLAMPQSYISKVERYERRLDVIEFATIARALGLEPGRLMQSILNRL